MIRVLALIAVVGFVLSVTCIGAAAAISGRDVAERGWDIPSHWNIHVDDDDDDWDSDEDGDHTPGGGPETTREIAWDGSSALDVNLPAEVEYAQGAGPAKLIVTGPRGAVE